LPICHLAFFILTLSFLLFLFRVLSRVSRATSSLPLAARGTPAVIDLAHFDSPLFTDAYRRILAQGAAIAEPRQDYPAAARPSLRERIVRCIWFDQSLATDKLRTDDGRKLRVLSPGWWNLEAGPDFRNAALRIAGGPVTKGDVEVHLLTTLWRAHGHHTDPNYNGVILHVVLWNDAGTKSVTTAAGTAVPQLTLEPYLTSPVAELADAVDPAEYPEASDAASGRCQRLIADGKATPEWIARFLDHAGDQRIAAKAHRLASRAAGDDDQLLYETVAEGLGYKRNKAPLLQLARRMPLTAIRERTARRPNDTPLALAVEALLFGMAGLLPDDRGPAPADDAVTEHVARLRRLWAEPGRDLADETLDPAQWSFDGTRPVNFPTRRIAALARFVAAHIEHGLNRAMRRALTGFAASEATPRELSRRRAQFLGLFLSLSDPFWSLHTTFTARPSSRPARLVGTDRAHTIVINGLLPALLYQARRDGDRAFEEALHRFYASYPKLPTTSVTRFMSLRLFGRPEKEVKLLRSARRQQGLYQLHADFCDSDHLTCAQCPLARLLEG
jgi:hypothetical protein